MEEEGRYSRRDRKKRGLGDEAFAELEQLIGQGGRRSQQFKVAPPSNGEPAACIGVGATPGPGDRSHASYPTRLLEDVFGTAPVRRVPIVLMRAGA